MTRAALRKLWLSDPVFANLDGLNDYDEDFNVVDTLLSALESDTTRGARIFTKKVVTKPRSRARTFRIMMTSGGHPHGRAIG